MDQFSPVLAIAVAAELAGMHPQTLRQYDRIGLVRPKRTSGRSRRYSMHDVEQLREVQRLSNEGVSLEGIARILSLENEVSHLKSRVRELENALSEEVLRSNRVFAAGEYAGDVTTLTHGTRTRRRTEIVLWQPRRRDG